MFPESSAPSVNWGLVCVCKSVGGSSQVPRIRRSNNGIRQKIGPSGDCEWTAVSRRLRKARPTNLVSERVRRRQRAEDAGKEERRKTQQIRICRFAICRCLTFQTGDPSWNDKTNEAERWGRKRERKERRERDGNGGTRETGTRGAKEYCEAENSRLRKICDPNWTQTSSWTRRAEPSSKAAKQYPSFREMVQSVREKEGGVAALAAVW